MNSDRWAEARHGYGTVPVSHYISASSWADHFIVNDDNFGMYVTLPTEAVKNIIVPKYNPNLYAAVGIGVLPKRTAVAGVNLEEMIPGFFAEQLAAVFLRKIVNETTPSATNRWFVLLKNGGHTPVCRTVLRQKADYLLSLSEMRDEKGNTVTDAEKKLLEGLLPERVWVTEIMTPALYVGNKRKLGEILVKSSAPKAEIQSRTLLVFAWLAGVRWHGPQLNDGPFEWSLTGHVPLARGIPAEKCKLEW